MIYGLIKVRSSDGGYLSFLHSQSTVDALMSAVDRNTRWFLVGVFDSVADCAGGSSMYMRTVAELKPQPRYCLSINVRSSL